MSGSAEKTPGPHLLDYVRERFTTLEQHLSGRLNGQNKIIDKIEQNLGDKVELLRRETAAYCTKSTVDALEMRIRELESTKSENRGALLIISSVTGIVVIVINFLIRTLWQ